MATSNFLKKMSVVTIGSALVFVGLLGNSQSASAQTVTFEGQESTAPYPNGTTFPEAPGISFSDTILSDPTGDLFVVNPGPTPDSTAVLTNFDDDASAIQLDFAPAVTSVALDYGNDIAPFASPGDQARLDIFNGNTLLTTVFQDLNLNSAVDQTIGFADGAFTRAVFTYTDAAGTPINLIEAIDNVQVEPVPEPSSVLGLLTFGTFGAIAMLKRKRAKCNN